jgi:hypothetical protein
MGAPRILQVRGVVDARAGLSQFVLIDFDEIQPHNLDRLALLREVGLGSEPPRRQGRQETGK